MIPGSFSLRTADSSIALIAATCIALFYNGLHIQLYAVACIVLAAAFLAALWHPRTSRIDIGAAGVTLFALTAWTALSLSWSLIPYLTTIQLGVLSGAIVGYIVVRLGGDDRVTKLALATLFAGLGLVFSAAMIGQIAHGQRPEGPFLNVNTAGAFVNLLWPVSAALALHPRLARMGLSVCLCVTAIMAFAVGLTGGRAVLLALVACLSTIGIGGWVLAARGRLLALIATVTGAVTASFAAGKVIPDIGIRGLGHRMASLSDPEAAGASRFRIWEATLDMIMQHPWLGRGLGTFHQAYPAYRPRDDGSAGLHVHNDYLQYWVEGGLPAMLLLIVIGAACILLFVRGIRRPSANLDNRIMLIAGAGVVAGAGIHAFFSYNLQILAYVIVLGAAMGALETGSGASRWFSLPLKSALRKPLPRLALLLLVATAIVHFVAVGASAHYTNRGAGYLAVGEYQTAAKELGKAARLWNAQDLARGLRARVFQGALVTVPEEDLERRSELKRRGLEEVALARARNPLRSMHEHTRGRILNESPDADPVAAATAFRSALALNPRNASARIDLARLLLEQDRFRDALDLVNEGFGMHYSENNPIQLMELGVELREQDGNAEGADSLRRQIRGFRDRAEKGGRGQLSPLRSAR